MSSSHTLNLQAFLSGPFSTISVLLERSASLPERIMLMEVLISTFSAISDEKSSLDDPITLMSRASTQTLSHLVDVQEKVGIMRQKMETLLQGAWRGRAEVDFLRLRINGAKLSAQKVERSFLTCYANWIRRLLLPNGPSLIDTQTQPTPLEQNPMWVPLGSNLSLEWYLSWLDGEESLLRLLD